MKKIVFMSMIMQNLNAVYKLSDKSKCSYKEPINFPISVKLSEDMNKDDDVKIVVIKMTDGITPYLRDGFAKNFSILQNELTEINKDIGANIHYEVIESDFSETKDVFKKRFMEMFDKVEPDCKLYADVTFGTKTTSLLIMNILNFGERFYGDDVEAIVYGKTLFKDYIDEKNGKKISRPDPATASVCDVTMLYLLNNLMNDMDYNTGDEAKQALNIFFGNN